MSYWLLFFVSSLCLNKVVWKIYIYKPLILAALEVISWIQMPANVTADTLLKLNHE
jgi:hypothetical protein